MVLAHTSPRSQSRGRLIGATLRAGVLSAVLFLAATLPGLAGILSPDYLFFEPETLPVDVYPSQPITGDGVNTPWQSVWTPADIAALDPGRHNISISGADILPVLVANPSSADGSYTTADLTAINLDNYHAYYMQQPGVDIQDPATDYVADLTSSILTVQFNASAVYAVRVETYSSATPDGPSEPRNYIYRQFVNAGFLGDGAPDAAGAQREVDIGDADIYIVSDPTPADPVLDDAAANLTAKGKKVVRAKNLADAQKAICDEATAKGRKVSVNMIGHGRPGSINIGGERITDDADKKTTPAAFQKAIDKCADSIAFTSCSTANGKKGDKFLQDFANSIGIASGWTVAVTVEGAVKDKDGNVKKAGYFDVEATGKKVEDVGVRATEPIYSSPTWFRPAFFDVFFYGSDDGFMYAQTAFGGGVVDGFPVDTRDMELPGVTGAVPIRSRPATYFATEAAPSLYFTTVAGHVISMALDGSVRWVAWPDPGASNCSSTPAVTPGGSVFVALNGVNGPRVWKLDAATGAVQGQSPPLGLPGSDSSAPSVAGNLVYLGVTQPLPGQGALIVLDNNLTPRAAGIGAGEAVISPPFVRGQFMYDGTMSGNLYKVNSVNTSPDPTFAGDGSLLLGEPMTVGPFAVEENPGDVDIYVGTDFGRLYRVSATGVPSPLFDTASSGDPAAIGGIVTIPFGPGKAVAFGAGRHFHVVPVSSPGSSFSFLDRGLPGGGFSTTPVYVPSIQTFAIGNLDGYVYAFPLS